MECVVYMRVSTEKQAEEGNGLESQKRDIENYCKKNEYIITDYYIDDKVRNKHQFLLNYSNMDMEGLEDALGEIRQILQGNEMMH